MRHRSSIEIDLAMIAISDALGMKPIPYLQASKAVFRGLVDDHSVKSLETDEPPRMEAKLSRADFNARISHAVQMFRDKPLYQFATHLRIASRYFTVHGHLTIALRLPLSHRGII